MVVTGQVRSEKESSDPLSSHRLNACHGDGNRVR